MNSLEEIKFSLRTKMIYSGGSQIVGLNPEVGRKELRKGGEIIF